MDHTPNTTLLFSFLFFITYLITIASSKDLCNQNDKNTLLKIKKSLNNPYHLASWDPDSDCCSWYCLECGDATVNYRVISLTIFAGQISGQIPPEVGDLPYIQRLTFHKLTNITGQIPSTITKLKHLRFLTLSRLNLTGPVPEFLNQLMNLEYLNLSFNQLSGSIPSSLSSLPKLTGIDISRNKLTGTIPESFGSFAAQVPYLILSHNQLSGSIPKSLGNNDFQDGFNVSYNRLCGPIPTGGSLQRFDYYTYFHNKCLCGAPLDSCK